MSKGCQYRHSDSVRPQTSNLEDYLTMITLEQFRNLSPEEKNEEIMQRLPLIIPLGENIASLRDSMDEALEKIAKLECEYEIVEHKTGSVDENFGASHDNLEPGEHINRTNSETSSNRSRDGLHLSGVSSFNQPLPDISGRES